MKRLIFILFLLMTQFIVIAEAGMQREKPLISKETEACIGCHRLYTPGIVEDWMKSLHSKTSPSLALKKPEIERRISAKEVPSRLKNIVVGCYECHSLNTERHKDSFDHMGYKINVVVSINDCSTCHPVEAQEYSESKKAYASINLTKNPVYHSLVETIISKKTVEDGRILQKDTSDFTRQETCFSCHGTEVKVDGMKEVDTEIGKIMLPVLKNWPNQGVGRVNPDGSMGACTACHPRHSFSIKIARKPDTCGQCHLEHDVPAYNVYKESKHGNIYASL